MTIKNLTTTTTYATIQGAIDDLPSPLTAPVVLEDIDGDAYAEDVEFPPSPAYLITLRAGTPTRIELTGSLTVEGGNVRVEDVDVIGDDECLVLKADASTDPRTFLRCSFTKIDPAADAAPVVRIESAPSELTSCLIRRATDGTGPLIKIDGGELDMRFCTLIQPESNGVDIAGACLEYVGSGAGDVVQARGCIFRFRGEDDATEKNAILRFGTTDDRDRYTGNGNVFSRYTGVGSNANHVAHVVTGATTYTALADWDNTGEDVNSIEANAAFPAAALFTDETYRDYRLAAASPARNAALTSHTALTDRDLLMIPRPYPVGGRNDIGAYEREYDQGSIHTPRSASAFGALDLDAIADGSAFGALEARTLGEQANRLLAKRHQVLTLIWPVTTTTVQDLAQYRAEWTLGPLSTMLMPPMAVLKKPGITGATAYWYARLESDRKAWLRVGTQQLDVELQQETLVTGVGAFAWYSTTIQLEAGEIEQIRLYARHGDAGALLNTGTYGSPATGTVGSGALGFNHLELSGSHSLDDTLVDAGHYIQFLLGGRVYTSGVITGIHDQGSRDYLTFSGPTDAEINLLQQQSRLGSVTFEIRELPWMALGQVLVVSDERAF